MKFESLICSNKMFQEQAPKQARQYPDGQEETPLARNPPVTTRRQTATGDDTVQMGVVGHGRAPGVQNGRESQVSAQVFRIGSKGTQGFCRHFEQQVVNQSRILEGDITNTCRQREDDMVVLDRQQLGLAIGKPLPGRAALALGTVSITARIVGDLCGGAIIALQHVTAQGGGATLLDRRHGLQLSEADMPSVAFTPLRAVAAENFRHLQRGSDHDAGSFERLDLQVFQRPLDLA